ncbi:MAG: hypothetical protein CMJ31_04775 [Phycisphaerae bacterium]|nr:hypothetical protein [Phycisphaerae bacterium]
MQAALQRSWLPVVAALVALAFSTSAASAQASNDPATMNLPPAEEIYERYIEAIGGRDKGFAIKRKEFRGVYDGEPFENTVILRLWQEYPNKWALRISEPAGRTVNSVFDGEHGWQSVEPGRSMWLEGTKALEMRENAEFYGEANYKERYKSIETLRRAVFRDKECYLVASETHSGRKYIVVFEVDSGLQAGVQAYVTEGAKRLPFTVTYDKYQEFDGIMIPTEITQQIARDGARPSIWKLRDAIFGGDEHDYSAPESMGEPPADDGSASGG